jgi:hypothetical protein
MDEDDISPAHLSGAIQYRAMDRFYKNKCFEID